jgi:hypothetical protein
MAASKLQANWTAVAFAGSSITRVTSCSFSQGGQLAEFAADDDRYPTVLANLMCRPTASITSADVAALMAISPGTVGSLTATHADALRGSGGSVVYVLSNAVSENAQDTGPFGQFGTATLNFRAFSTDGSTNPLAFTRL